MSKPDWNRLYLNNINEVRILRPCLDLAIEIFSGYLIGGLKKKKK